MRYRLALMIGGLLFMVLVVGSLASAQELHVGEGQEYPTLSAAHANASAGDVLVLHGTLNDTFNVTKEVTIRGVDSESVWRISEDPVYIQSPGVVIRDLNIGHIFLLPQALWLEGGGTSVVNVTFTLAQGIVVNSSNNSIIGCEFVTLVSAIEIQAGATGNTFADLFIHDTPIAFSALAKPVGNLIRNVTLERTNLLFPGDNDWEEVTLDGRPVIMIGPDDPPTLSGQEIGALIIADAEVTLDDITLIHGGMVVSDSQVTVTDLRSDNASFSLYFDGGTFTGERVVVTGVDTNGLHFENADRVDITAGGMWAIKGTFLNVEPGVGPVTITGGTFLIDRGASFILQAPGYQLSGVDVRVTDEALLFLNDSGVVKDATFTGTLLQADLEKVDHDGLVINGMTYRQIWDLAGEDIPGGNWDHVWIRNVTSSTITDLEIAIGGTLKVRDSSDLVFADLRMVQSTSGLVIRDSRDLAFTGCHLSAGEHGFDIDASPGIGFSECWIFAGINGSIAGGVVNATRTWWGGTDGPRIDVDQAGTSELLIGPIDFHPYYREASHATLIGFDGQPVDDDSGNGAADSDTNASDDDPWWSVPALSLVTLLLAIGSVVGLMAVIRRRS